MIMMDSGNLKVVFNLSSCKMPGIRGGDGVIMDGPLLTRRGDSLFFFCCLMFGPFWHSWWHIVTTKKTILGYNTGH